MFGTSTYCLFSFGGGVQSSAIYLMLIHEPKRLLGIMGELPDKVYFADTGAETASTYEALQYMQAYKSRLFEIETVNNGHILEAYYADGGYKPKYPFFFKTDKGTIAMAHRYCTRDYKIQAIYKAFRQACNLEGKQLSEGFLTTWLGISVDEPERFKDSREKWNIRRYPLLELSWNRQDCIDYCKQHNWVPAKSRCYCCPYQSDANWLDMKVNYPDEFEKACIEDDRLRSSRMRFDSSGYLHRSCAPLREVKFKGEDSDSFGNEREGMCGT